MAVQWTREDLTGKSPDAILAARQGGHLKALMGQRLTADEAAGAIVRGDAQKAENDRQEAPADGLLRREDLARMSPEDIVHAKRDGRLDHLLG